MKALWIVSAEVRALASGREDEEGILASPVASARMRTAVAALEWKRAGHENVFWSPATGAQSPDIDWGSVHVCVVPKFYFDVPLEPWREACLAASKQRCPLVIDITDYPFRKPQAVQAFYSEAFKICDAVVVNSQRMAELMAPHIARRPVVIDDAILAPMRGPQFAPAGRVHVLWFGHASNLDYLDASLEGLLRLAGRKPCSLTIVTEAGVGAEQAVREIDARCAPGLEARFVEWSLQAMATALRRCDLVLIPGDPADPSKSGVSANRLAETLRAGRFAVASPLPSYLAFAHCAWLGHDLADGVSWALANPGEVRARIRTGQALVNDTLTPGKIGREWRDLLEGLATARGR